MGGAGGTGTEDPADQALSTVSYTPDGAGTGTGGGGTAVFLGGGAEGVTQSSPKANAWSWARRLPRAGPATTSGSRSFEAIVS